MKKRSDKMSISILDINRINYISLQNLFMNIPFKEYINYIYPRTGHGEKLTEAVHFLTEICRCSENYIIDFERDDTDDSMTVGQLLRIATSTLDSQMPRNYPEYNPDKIMSIGIRIVELLIIIPFAGLTDGSYQYEKMKRVKSAERLISTFKEQTKETINNG